MPIQLHGFLIYDIMISLRLIMFEYFNSVYRVLIVDNFTCSDWFDER